MIGLLVVSHGRMAAGLLDGMRLIVGEQENTASVGLFEGDAIESLREKVLEKINGLRSEEGVIIFVDLFGASPYITCARIAHDYPEKQLVVITGVNLPLLIEAALGRQTGIPVRELAESLLQKGRDQIRIFPEN